MMLQEFDYSKVASKRVCMFTFCLDFLQLHTLNFNYAHFFIFSKSLYSAYPYFQNQIAIVKENLKFDDFVKNPLVTSYYDNPTSFI